MLDHPQTPTEGSEKGKVARRRSRTRAELLDVAADKFLEFGVENVSVDDIIDTVGISRGTFYSLFDSRDDLVHQIIQPVLIQGISALKDIKEPDARERLRAVLRVYVHMWVENARALVLAFKLNKRFMQMFEPEHMMFSNLVENHLKAVAEGGLLKFENDLIARRLIGRCAIDVLTVLQDEDAFEDTFLSVMEDMLVRQAVSHGVPSAQDYRF